MPGYKKLNPGKLAFHYGLSGFLAGLVFPLAATLIRFPQHTGITFSHVLTLHLQDPLLQIVDLIPLILFFTGMFVAYRAQSQAAGRSDTGSMYKSLIEDAAEVIYITDYKGNFTYFNKRVETNYGFKPEELSGKHFTTLINPSMLQTVQEFYRIQFDKKIPETIRDLQIIDKQGNPRWIEQTVMLRMKNGRVEGFHGVIRDIDQRVKQEEEIKSLNSTLESKLMELETANQELDAFNHSVSHDLRSPLRGISTLAEILQSEFGEGMPEEAKQILTRIIRNSNKIQHLVEDLLEFARVGRQDITIEPVSMRQLVDQILEESLTSDSENNISVQVDNLADARCDKKLMNQVWVNLISNALKYSSGKPNPQIRIGSYFKNNEQVYFVRDNGAGFDMTYYKKLFNVFSRLHHETEFSGTGVGLSIVKRIVERHGGKVWGEGQPGIGATFYFSLPHEGSQEETLNPAMQQTALQHQS